MHILLEVISPLAIMKVFSFESRPDMKMVLAVRISMSIPVLFTAVQYANCTWVDGGVAMNFPIQYFDNFNRFCDKNWCVQGATGATVAYNQQTLGLKVDSMSEIFDTSNVQAIKKEDQFPVTHQQINKMYDYAQALTGYVINNTQAPLKRPDRDRTVFIHDAGISTTNFNLTDDDKKSLVDSGEKWTRAYLNWFAAGQALWLKQNPSLDKANLDSAGSIAPTTNKNNKCAHHSPPASSPNEVFMQNFYGSENLNNIQRKLSNEHFY